MNWGRFDEAAWWWEYGLDGLAGGVIGGVVTALAVWMTLRHERALTQVTEKQQRELAELMTARALGLDALGASWMLFSTFGKDEQARGPESSEGVALLQALVTFKASIKTRWPEQADEVQRLGSRVETELKKTPRELHAQDVRDAIKALAEHLRTWEHPTATEFLMTPPARRWRRGR